MIPALEERMDMKQSLDPAMEVQQNLLPQKMPIIKGLDIAGQSIYCDQTGGDLFYVQINPGEKKLRWVRAGHDPAVFYDPTMDILEELQGKGVALGIDADVNYQGNVEADLSRGQLLLVGTDGLWETRNPAGEMFGKKRLKTLIRKHSRLSAGEMLSSILEALKSFRDSAKQEDDITPVVAKVVE